MERPGEQQLLPIAAVAVAVAAKVWAEERPADVVAEVRAAMVWVAEHHSCGTWGTMGC